MNMMLFSRPSVSVAWSGSTCEPWLFEYSVSRGVGDSHHPGTGARRTLYCHTGTILQRRLSYAEKDGSVNIHV